MSIEIGKLLKAAQMGEVEAFEALAGSYYKTVYNIILVSCGEKREASGLAQEVFVRVFRNMGRIGSIQALRTSIYKTVRDVCSEDPEKIRKIS